MSSLTIYLEERFLFFKNEYYSLVYDDAFWQRYLEVFASIKVVARVYEVTSDNQVTANYRKITDKRIVFIHLPYYHGLIQGISKLPSLMYDVFQVVKVSEVNILRLPGLISILAGLAAIDKKKIFAVELVGDPYQVFDSGVGGKLAPILKITFTKLTQHIIKKSVAVSYVTQRVLQKRYPPRELAYTTHYSSINLPLEIFDNDNIRNLINKENINILMVGSLEQRYKGFDIALKAINLVNFKNNVILHIVGNGLYASELKNLAHELNLSNQVVFHGKISHDKVFDMMKAFDIFLMPSRTEGLPRALIEAMAFGLPSIGSNVGGIPELLEEEFIFEKEDERGLAQLIEKLVYTNDIRTISRRNMQKAYEYNKVVLDARRFEFYKFIKDSVRS